MFLYKKLSFVLMLLFLSVGVAIAQTTVSGTVFSADDNEPLMGANILVEGTQTRAITDLDGNFTLKDKTGSIRVSLQDRLSAAEFQEDTALRWDYSG